MESCEQAQGSFKEGSLVNSEVMHLHLWAGVKFLGTFALEPGFPLLCTSSCFLFFFFPPPFSFSFQTISSDFQISDKLIRGIARVNRAVDTLPI